MVFTMYILRKSQRFSTFRLCIPPRRLTSDKDEVEHQKKADHIVNTVLQAIDLDHDGVITADELERVGLDGLPNFENMGAEGHHYDVESGKFTHHTLSILVLNHPHSQNFSYITKVQRRCSRQSRGVDWFTSHRTVSLYSRNTNR